MTVLNPITGVQSLGAVLDAVADRRDRSMQWETDATGKVISGVVPGWGSEFSVSINSSTLVVTIGSGAAILGAPTAGHGCWPCVNDASVAYTLNARNASNPRVDLIIARVADPAYYAGGDGAAAVEILAGSPSSSPVPPTVPTAKGSYVVLGQLTVPSAANGGAVTLGNATAYTQVPRALLAGEQLQTYVPTFAQTNNIALDATFRNVKWSRSGTRVLGDGNLLTATTHSGGGGRPRLTLPVPHAEPLDAGYSMIGTFFLVTPGLTRVYYGPLVGSSTIGASQVYLKNSDGYAITDTGGNFDMPAGTHLTFTLNYRVA